MSDCVEVTLCKNEAGVALQAGVTAEFVICGTGLGGGGITSLNGLTAPAQSFADVDDTNVTLGIGSAAGVHTFTVGWTGTLALARGGTGSATAAGARTNLGLDIGTDVQAWDADLDALAALTPTKGNLIIGNGSTWVALGIGADGTTLTADAAEASGAKWALSGSGDFVGPASSTDNAIVRFDGTTGKLGQNSGATIDDSGNITATNISGTNTGDQTITLTTDVTGSGTGVIATTIANNAVTYAKMQDVSGASLLLGRGSAGGGGDPEEITLGTNLSMSGTTLNATAGGSQNLFETIACPAGTNPVADSTTDTLTLANGSNIEITGNATTDTVTIALGAHATRHQSGGNDAIKLDDLAAPDDNTDLNASASAHGLLPKLSGSATDFLNGTGAFSVPAGVSDHGALTGLSDDDHAQYALLAGRATGQTLAGGTAASESLTLQSTTNATKGNINLDSIIKTASTGVIVGDTTQTLASTLHVSRAGASGTSVRAERTTTLTSGLFNPLHLQVTTSSTASNTPGVFGISQTWTMKDAAAEAQLAGIRVYRDGATNSGTMRLRVASTGTLTDRIKIDSNGDIIFAGATGRLRFPYINDPTINTNGDVGFDSTVTDFSHGILKVFAGEEMGVITMPIAQFTTPTNGHVIAYNATNDEFELVAQTGGSGEWTLAGTELHPNTDATTNVIVGATTIGLADIILNSSGQVIINEQGASINPALRVEGVGDANLLYVNGTSNRVGMGASAPTAKLDIRGATVTAPVLAIRTTDNSSVANIFAAQNAAGTSFVSIPGARPWAIQTLNSGRSTFIGENAGLVDDLNNRDNVWIGFDCGRNSTDGDGNLAIGKDTLKAATTPRFNAAIGGQCMRDGDAPFGNAGFGYSVLLNVTGNVFNTAMGYNTARDLISGFRNTFLGNATAFKLTTGCNYNTFVGERSGFNLIGSSSRNTWIGAETGRGGAASVDYGPVSDTVYIGYRAGRDNTTSQRLFIDVTETLDPLIYGEFNTNLVRVNGSFETTDQVRVGTTSVASSGTKAIMFGDNGGTPTAVAGTAGIFARNDAGTIRLYALDVGGETPLSPHDSETGEWVFRSTCKDGRHIRVDMERFFREQFPEYFYESKPLENPYKVTNHG